MYNQITVKLNFNKGREGAIHYTNSSKELPLEQRWFELRVDTGVVGLWKFYATRISTFAP